ncbi:hypothetical protein ACOMHN_027812 [Nucella lapillus]
MTSDDAGMQVTTGSVVGLVVAGLLCLLFLVSCIVSVVKAVRDRRHIKARIAAKRAEQLNGHAPRAKKSSVDEGRRGRPNILIVHDDQREERVKKGISLSNSASSPRFPSGVSSPEDQTSRRTDSTTVAEVACHHSSRTTSPGEDDTEGLECGMDALYNGRCSLPGRINDGDDFYDCELNTRMDISREVIEYRRSSLVNSDPNCAVTSFSSYPCHAGDGTKRGKDSGTGNREQGGRKGKDSPRRRDVSPSSLKYVADHDIVCDLKETERVKNPVRDKTSPSRPFTKKKKGSSHHVAAHGAAEVVCVAYNPRRNSYAAAIASDPDWLDRTTVRRHSDEPRHPAASSSHVIRDNVRVRSECRQGADNPAYNAADDRIAL